MGGGGGDGGYSKNQRELERKRQLARNAMNVYFGIAPTGDAKIKAADYLTGVATSQRDDAGGLTGATSTLVMDNDAYQAALAEQAKQTSEASKNKAALDALYKTVREDAYTAGKTSADDQRDQAARDLKFELFARGLNSGSVDVDQSALLGRTYSDALTQLGASADTIATKLKANDEAARLGLLQSIDNGMDQGSAISSALQQLQNNASASAADATGNVLGDLFTNVGLLYDQGRKARGEATALDAWRQGYGSTYGRTSSSTSGGRTGVSSWAG